MAINNLDVSWSGPAAGYILTREVIAAETIQSGCVFVQDSIRKKITIPRLEVKDFIQRYSAVPTSIGNQVEIDGRVIEPKKFSLYFEFIPAVMEDHFYTENFSDKLIDRSLPNPVQAYMVMQLMKRLNEFFENAIWRGRIEYDPLGAAVSPVAKGDTIDAAEYFYFDGLIKRLLDDASLLVNPTILVPTPGVLVSGTPLVGQENIKDALDRTYKLLPKALVKKYNTVKFLVSVKTWQVYEDYLSLQPFKSIDVTEPGVKPYRNYKVVMLPSMPDNTIVACVSTADTSSNLWIGLNSKDDETYLKLMPKDNFSDVWFVKGLYKMATQTGFPDQCVLYSTLIP